MLCYILRTEIFVQPEATDPEQEIFRARGRKRQPPFSIWEAVPLSDPARRVTHAGSSANEQLGISTSPTDL
jgi:hypothetical protein